MKTIAGFCLLIGASLCSHAQNLSWLHLPTAKPSLYAEKLAQENTELKDELAVRDAQLATFQIGVKLMPLQMALQLAEMKVKAAADKVITDKGKDPNEFSLDTNTWKPIKKSDVANMANDPALRQQRPVNPAADPANDPTFKKR